MNHHNGTQPLASPTTAPETDNMAFGQYPTEWYNQSSSFSASPQQQHRRPSNPIAIPRSSSVRKPSGANPISTTAPVICMKCGLHSRPTSAEIIQTGGCSPRDVKLPAYFPGPPSRLITDTTLFSQAPQWSTGQCCEGWSPDTPLSSRRLSDINNIDSQRRRHHHRRRSSLYQPQNVIVDEDVELKWRCSGDVLSNNKNEADQIARKVVERNSNAGGSRRRSKTSVSSVSTASVISEL